MAQRVHTVLIDDIDGGDAEETVTFGLDGNTYEIDLSAENTAKLREALDPYMKAARRQSGGRGGRRAGRGRGSSGSNAADIREWARAHGHRVNDRGRVPAEIRQQYERETSAASR